MREIKTPLGGGVRFYLISSIADRSPECSSINLLTSFELRPVSSIVFPRLLILTFLPFRDRIHWQRTAAIAAHAALDLTTSTITSYRPPNAVLES